MTDIKNYIDQIAEDKKDAFLKLRDTLRTHLPEGFIEDFNSGMLGFVIPKSTFPGGYHCNPETPLPFINLAAQKNFIALYHMGLYADQDLLNWFTAEYPKHAKTKLDMGKSCIRFKKMNDIPYPLIGRLAEKMTPGEWVNLYEKIFKQ
jgi:hypothetical protein